MLWCTYKLVMQIFHMHSLTPVHWAQGTVLHKGPMHTKKKNCIFSHQNTFNLCCILVTHSTRIQVVEVATSSMISVRTGFVRKKVKVIVDLKNNCEFLEFQCSMAIILFLTLTPNFLREFHSHDYTCLLYIYFYSKAISQLAIVHSPQF